MLQIGILHHFNLNKLLNDNQLYWRNRHTWKFDVEENVICCQKQFLCHVFTYFERQDISNSIICKYALLRNQAVSNNAIIMIISLELKLTLLFVRGGFGDCFLPFDKGQRATWCFLYLHKLILFSRCKRFATASTSMQELCCHGVMAWR